MSPARSPRRVLFVLFFGVLMAALDIAIVGPSLPALREHFGVSERDVAWVLNAFVLFNLLGLPLMAKLSDVLGRRLVYASAVTLFAVGSVVVASSSSFAMLLVGRGMQGAAASGIFPAASAVVGDVFPPERRGRALGVLGSVYGLAFIVGPILAGILLQFGWRWLFLVNLPLALGVGVAALRVLPGTRAEKLASIDWPGIATLGVLLAALAYGLNQLDASAPLVGLLAVNVWPFLLTAFVLLPVFVRLERRAPDPLLRLRLFQSRQVVLVSLLATGAGLTEAAFVFFPALAVAAFGVTTSAASFMLLPLVFAVAIASPVAGRLLDRVGSRVVVLVGTAGLTLGLAVIGLATASKAAFYGGSILIGLGLAGLLGSSLSYILLSESRETERTVAQGIITLFISIGQLVGAALIGAVVASGDGGVAGYADALLLIAGAGLLLLLASLGLKRRQRELGAVEQDR